MIIKNNKNCSIKINDKTITNLSAKEMFEKLNYFQSSEDFEDELVYNLNSKDVESYRYISFHKIFNYIEVNDWTSNFQLSVQELQAINKQVEELRWNK